MKPVTDPSLFFFQLTIDGTPAGAFLAAGLAGMALAFGLGFGVSLSPAPNSDIVLRDAGAGLGAGGGVDVVPAPKRLIVAPRGAFFTVFFA